MVIFHSYVSLPKGKPQSWDLWYLWLVFLLNFGMRWWFGNRVCGFALCLLFFPRFFGLFIHREMGASGWIYPEFWAKLYKLDKNPWDFGMPWDASSSENTSFPTFDRYSATGRLTVPSTKFTPCWQRCSRSATEAAVDRFGWWESSQPLVNNG